MLKIFYGEDRLAIEREIKRIFGEKYEVFEGEAISEADLASIFMGATLFETEVRKILLKNLSENAAVWEKVDKYVETKHEVIIWEQKMDKRLAGYKNLKEIGVEMREFVPKKPTNYAIFGILELALKDGKAAITEVEKIEAEQDPFMFMGLLVSQALKRLEMALARNPRGGEKEKRILRKIAEADMWTKNREMDAWMAVKILLLGLEKI